MKKRIYAALLALAMVSTALLAGCASLPSLSSPGPAEDGTPAPAEDASGARASFLSAQTPLYDPDLTPCVPDYEIAGDLSNVINYDEFSYVLQGRALEMLLENGFVVTQGYGGEFFENYETNRYNYTPNFVTTDAMMHTYHLYFSRLLKGIEKDWFLADLTQLSAAMQAQSEAQLAALAGTEWENAAKRNVAFFAVAQALLGQGDAAPAEVSAVVEQELARINAADGISPSAVLAMGGGAGGMEDYSQYTPRGYYSTSDDLSRYFRAMMWFGRMSFSAGDEDQSRSALLMTLALKQSDAMTLWERIYAVTAFFAGSSDDPGVYEYAALAESAYGGLPETERLPDLSGEWGAFVQSLATLEAPAINSIPVSEDDELETTIQSFRFMGQRFTLDAAVFQQLVYRQVGENAAGERRMLPSALDVPAALGSETARELLRQAGADDYANYTENMDKLRAVFADAPESLWNASLYNGWLHTLLPLTQEKGEGYPMFMRGSAWAAKSLNTFLGSWAELKHDTILYAKQVYAEMGGGDEPQERDDRGYVEPEPVLFGRLAALCAATKDGLDRFGVLRDADAESLDRLAQLSAQLMTIAEKELRNELPTDEEFELIRTFGGQLEHFWYDALEDENGGQSISVQDFPAAIIADVATDPNGTVLEVGSGRVDNIYVVVNVGGSLRIAQGSVYSFYEFPYPLSDRLTDRRWREMLGIDPIVDADGNWIDGKVDVPRPTWSEAFLAPLE